MEDTVQHQNGPWTPASLSGSDDQTDGSSEDGRRLSPFPNQAQLAQGLVTMEQPRSSPCSEQSNDSAFQGEMDEKKPDIAQDHPQMAQYDFYRPGPIRDPYHPMGVPMHHSFHQPMHPYINSNAKFLPPPTVQHPEQQQHILHLHHQQQQQQQQHLLQQPQQQHHLQVLDFSKTTPPPPSQGQGSPYGSVKDEPYNYTPPPDSDTQSSDSGYFKQTPISQDWSHQTGFPFWPAPGVPTPHSQFYNPVMMANYKPPHGSPWEGKPYPMSDVPPSPVDSEASRDSASSCSRDSLGSFRSSSPYHTKDNECFKKRTRRQRTSFNRQQVDELERLFAQNQYVDTFVREDLGHRLNLREDVIRVWFKNRRAKQKRNVKCQQEGIQPTTPIPASSASLPTVDLVPPFPQSVYTFPATINHPSQMALPGFPIDTQGRLHPSNQNDRRLVAGSEMPLAH